ncbi:MAG TPA: ferritin-like domain-containing protein [Verrucomicrobiae bacterium]|nr:ferritin-like domain-containing protein [Verrucomicrobiae bacterium]
MRIDLGDLGFDEGGHLLVKRALRRLSPGAEVEVGGTGPDLELHLATWCRAQGHRVRPGSPAASGALAAWIVTRAADAPGEADGLGWPGAARAGHADASRPGAVVEHPPATWGLAARGARVEPGSPDFGFTLADRIEVWSDDAARLYAQAVAAQWDPATAVPWSASFELPDDVEDAVVQVMTYLIENETAALVIPSRFIARLHPHFREVMQLLAVQAADEARHIEVFTRRALLKRAEPGLSTAGGQASLLTLVQEPDFPIASFLLSVLGEGTFLILLRFLEEHAPDPVTAAVSRLAAQDEARHVAFGLAHLRRHLAEDPGFRARLASAVLRRHDALRHTAGLNAEVFDALHLLAAGSFASSALRQGHRKVQALLAAMDQGRKGNLERLGFSPTEAADLSSLHTRNFM